MKGVEEVKTTKTFSVWALRFLVELPLSEWTGFRSSLYRFRRWRCNTEDSIQVMQQERKMPMSRQSFEASLYLYMRGVSISIHDMIEL